MAKKKTTDRAEPQHVQKLVLPKNFEISSRIYDCRDSEPNKLKPYEILVSCARMNKEGIELRH